MDSNKIDSHKLMFHPERVVRWLATEEKENYVGIFPIYAEIGISGICNHKCTFCALDFSRNTNRPYLSLEVLKKIFPEISKLGVKSIMFGGEGEPLMHPHFEDIIDQSYINGLDIALTSNGVLLNDSKSYAILQTQNFRWIKISLNAGCAQTYSKIHGTSKEDFNKVINNLKFLIEQRNIFRNDLTIGIQSLLLPDNKEEMKIIAMIARDLGVDYFVVKPYSHHPKSITQKYKGIKYNKDDLISLQKDLSTLDSEYFKTLLRINAFDSYRQQGKDRNYKRCLALPFWTYINSKGEVWGCSSWLEDKKFYYGNVYIKTFEEIWKGKLRQRSLKWVEDKLDVSQYCRVNCRMNEINKYLWELKNPSKHVNFI